jgi:hypothetical protein
MWRQVKAGVEEWELEEIRGRKLSYMQRCDMFRGKYLAGVQGGGFYVPTVEEQI